MRGVDVDPEARIRASAAKRLRVLEAENAKLKKLLAEAMLDNEALKVVHGEMGKLAGAP